MNKSLFRYVWRHSRRDQLIIFAVVVASLPFYYMSLDLPRRIVNEAIQGRAFEQGQITATFLNLSISLPGWLGGLKANLFDGFQVERLQLLLGLSFMFLFLVLVNGWFKYWINVAKGSLGERMMRRMRFELFSYALRFTPEALRTVKSSEAATIIKDEVEPIGGFIGDAFIQPVFLGTQALTALLFILMQSIWLGLIAAAMVGIQFTIIPRMRRELLRLGRMRQIASRRLAGRVSEVIDGMEAVHVHDTSRWERAEVGHRLYELFDIRFRIYKRKFIVKFLNNLLAQMTPFFFYAVGGYFALRGQLDIGQLVAVIAAYRELPPPLKELIDWDQQRLDVQVKYDQVVGYFAAERLSPLDEREEGDAADEPLAGPLRVSGLTVHDHHGVAVLDGASFELELPASVAILSDGGPAGGIFARVLARRHGDFAGEIKVGEREIPHLARSVLGRHIAYAGIDPVLFPVSLRENLLYGLRQDPSGDVEADAEEARRIMEAQKTGNPVESIAANWVDFARSGAADAAELDGVLVDLFRRIGLDEDLYRFGLSGLIDPERYPRLAEKIVEARELLRLKLTEEGMADLVEPFDPERYNTQATIAENLLFGVPTAAGLMGRAAVDHAGFREALAKAGLTDDLVAMGARIAETMTDIFRGLPPGHPLFEQFSFVHADELDDYDAILKRFGVRGRGGATRDDRDRLLGLTLPYVETRHRLGLLGDEQRDKLLAGRTLIRQMLERTGEPGVTFYDPETINTAAPLRDNLLFGRVNERVADARERVRVAGSQVLDELDLRADIERVGLDHQAGPAGRLLTAAQRSGVNLMRCVIKRPDIVVVDGALAPFGDHRSEPVLKLLVEETAGRSLFVVLPDERRTELFGKVLHFTSDEVRVETPDEVVSAAAKRARPEAAE